MMLIPKFFSVTAALLFLATMASAQDGDESPSLFTCTQGVCTTYTDGCNQCSSPDGTAAGVMCTEMYCPCYDDNSCVPECQDNDSCVPIQRDQNQTDADPIQDGQQGKDHIFTCSEGVCTSYTDGCNECSSPDGTLANAVCTEMYCLCYEKDDCVPECFDNDSCVPVSNSGGGNANEENQENSLFVCSEGICTSFTDGCNECFVEDGNTLAAACTEMYCPCYDDNSCVPKCLDNPSCVPSAASESEMVECTPNGSEACPVVRCRAPPEGCSFVQDRFVLGEDGVCCPLNCYAVDENGTHCPYEKDPVDDMNGDDPVDDMNEENNAINVGARCNPDNFQSTATAMARQGGAECPVARCAEPQEGCTFAEGHFEVNEDGNCCPRLCYTVDSEGNECGAAADGDGEGSEKVTNAEALASSGNRKGLWLAFSWILGAFFLGRN